MRDAPGGWTGLEFCTVPAAAHGCPFTRERSLNTDIEAQIFTVGGVIAPVRAVILSQEF